MTHAFLTLAILWFVAAATPGPNFFAVMQMALGRGRQAALACMMGTVVGTAFWATAGFFGLKALFAAFPAAAFAIRLVGGCYLIWVGYSLWRNAGSISAGASVPLPARRAFLMGLTTNLANPKSAAFAASLFAVALPPDASMMASLAAIVMVCSISCLWYLLVAFLASTGPIRRAYMRVQRPLMRATGVLFAGFGVKLALE
ncbi:LysE family transporter [Rhodobacteraceae bacterium NNCM2]|nr:LysE family transporter [Coraliihabitans acroporae]